MPPPPPHFQPIATIDHTSYRWLMHSSQSTKVNKICNPLQKLISHSSQTFEWTSHDSLNLPQLLPQFWHISLKAGRTQLAFFLGGGGAEEGSTGGWRREGFPVQKTQLLLKRAAWWHWQWRIQCDVGEGGGVCVKWSPVQAWNLLSCLLALLNTLLQLHTSETFPVITCYNDDTLLCHLFLL